MKTTSYCTLLILLGTTACGSRGSASRDATSDGSSDAATSAAATSVYSAADTVTVDRGACFGQCPVYSVTMNGDGAVRFEGRAFVADSGLHEAQIDASAARAFFTRLDASGFSTADSAYVEGAPNCGQWFTDAPQLTLRRAQGTEAHTVRLDAGCADAPRWLIALAAAVDSVAGTDRWITSTPSQP